MKGFPMNKRRIAIILIFTFMALVLALGACVSTNSPLSSIETPQPMYAGTAAQSTLESGQSQIKALSHQATVISLNKDQAAKVAAQATLDSSQSQLMELSIQETEINQNMAQAAATQQFMAVQNQMAWDATDTAQSQAATQQYITYRSQMEWNSTATAQSQDTKATYSAYVFNVTQTAQVQALLVIQNATQQAYSLTATPWAAVQADIVRTRNESIRRSLWGEFIVTPLTIILITLVVLLLIVGGVMAYRQLIPALELRLRTIWRDNASPLLLVDGTVVDHVPALRLLTRRGLGLLKPPRPASVDIPQIEIIDPSEPSVTNWIAEAEHKLRSDGRM